MTIYRAKPCGHYRHCACKPRVYITCAAGHLTLNVPAGRYTAEWVQRHDDETCGTIGCVAPLVWPAT